MDKPTLADDASMPLGLDPSLLLAGAGVPLTADSVYALNVDGWRKLVLDLVGLCNAWLPGHEAELADDGSVELDSGIGFFTAVVLLTALGDDAIPADFIRRERLSSVDRVANLVFESAQKHKDAS